jgi:hypothetical protein
MTDGDPNLIYEAECASNDGRNDESWINENLMLEANKIAAEMTLLASLYALHVISLTRG